MRGEALVREVEDGYRVNVMQGCLHLQFCANGVELYVVCTGERRGELWQQTVDARGLVGPAMASDGTVRDVWSLAKVARKGMRSGASRATWVVKRIVVVIVLLLLIVLTSIPVLVPCSRNDIIC